MSKKDKERKYKQTEQVFSFGLNKRIECNNNYKLWKAISKN
jgi:hypothetical protein